MLRITLLYTSSLTSSSTKTGGVSCFLFLFCYGKPATERAVYEGIKDLSGADAAAATAKHKIVPSIG